MPSLDEDIPLSLPLKPDQRPLEQDPLEYMRKMLAFRRCKDHDYGLAQPRINNDRLGSLPAPNNFKGPTSLATVDGMHTAASTRLNELASIQRGLIEAVKSAPRPLLQHLLLLVDAGLNHDTIPHELDDNEPLTRDGIKLLEEMAEQSWDEARLEYGDIILGVENTPEDRGRLEEFERDILELQEIPMWEPVPDSNLIDDDQPFYQIEHDPMVPSARRISGDAVRQATGNQRMAKVDGSAGTPHLWDLKTVQRYLRAMASAGRIQ